MMHWVVFVSYTWVIKRLLSSHEKIWSLISEKSLKINVVSFNLLLGLGTQIWCGATYKVDKVYKLGTPICRISHTYDLAPSKESIIKA